ncbi:MAG: FkbM family methyltransferase [Gammaproteobacteria bacterium]|nr:FkbM family methyltransferase [Gammaproteobacteria bacterium]
MISGVLRSALESLGLASPDRDETPVSGHRLREVRRRLKLMSHHGIDLLLDVGANAGQYGDNIRASGYAGRIVSFEPVALAFAALARRAAGDDKWRVENCALGDRPGRQPIHVAANSFSSSFLDMLPEHLNRAPDSAYQGAEEVDVRTLDAVFPGGFPEAARVFLKIDTQGFERKVLEGARSSLESITGVQLEMSLLPLYRGETLFPEMLAYMGERGFSLQLIEPGFSDRRTGRLLQLDGIFFRD